MAKGGQFEREMCKYLSRWFSDGERDDLFWRSSNSGGRATVRTRKGKTTANQYGDMQATDPAGQPLLDLCTVEMKRGYNKHTLHDVLDRNDRLLDQKWEEWIKQVLREKDEAGRPAWLLITRRDRREALTTMPLFLYKLLNEHGARLEQARPHVRAIIQVNDLRVSVFTTTLTEFTACVDHENVRAAVDSLGL